MNIKYCSVLCSFTLLHFTQHDLIFFSYEGDINGYLSSAVVTEMLNQIVMGSWLAFGYCLLIASSKVAFCKIDESSGVTWQMCQSRVRVFGIYCMYHIRLLNASSLEEIKIITQLSQFSIITIFISLYKKRFI